MVDDCYSYYYWCNNTIYYDYAVVAVQKALNDLVSLPLGRPWLPIADCEMPDN